MRTTIPIQLREVVADHNPGTVILSPMGLPGRAVRLIKPAKFANFQTLAGLEAHELLATAEAHLAKLRQSGVRVPRFEYFFEDPDLVVVADEIRGWSFDRRFQSTGRRFPPIDQVQLDTYSAEARTGLKNYGHAVADQIHGQTNEPNLGRYMLAEITEVKQWMLGTSVPQPELGPGLTMVDPDPLVLLTTDTGLRSHMVWTDKLRPRVS